MLASASIDGCRENAMNIAGRLNAPELTVIVARAMPWRDGAESLARWRGEVAPFQRAVVRETLRALLHPHQSRHVVLIGLRRIGKTVAMRQCVAALIDRGIAADRIGWLRLDHPQLLAIPLGSLVQGMIDEANATRDDPVYMFLDEVTASKDWDLWLKTFYDEEWPVRIVATSSATSLLRTVRHESGAGRWREISLSPWLVHELGGFLGVPQPQVSGDLHSALLKKPHVPTSPQRFSWQWLAGQASALGGFPEGWNHLLGTDLAGTDLVAAQERLRAEIVENAIYRDLALAVGIEHPHKVEQLLSILAAQVGQIASPQKLGADIVVGQPTVDRYLAHLTDIHLVFRLYNYAPTEESMQRRNRKVFLADNAVCNAVLGRPAWTLTPSESGNLRENQVAVHLQAYATRRGMRLYYWRDAKKREVDFVLPDPAAPIAIEVASSANHGREGVRALAALRPELRGRIWLTWPEADWHSPETDPDGVGAYPTGELLAIAGKLSEGRVEV